MIFQGEEILREEPFVFVLKSTLRNEKCEFCFSPAQLKCSKCHYWCYCDQRCQKQAWPTHKLECNGLKKIFPKIVPDSAHMLIRLLLKLKTADSENDAGKKNEKKRPFKDLLSHVSKIQMDQRRMEHFTSIAVVVQSFFGATEQLNEEYLLELFGKVCINSFNILDNDMNSIGTGIYLNASILDHSCEPNAVATFNGTTIYIRSIKDIPESQLNKVYVSYIDILNLSSERKKELKSMYYFDCNCERCASEINDDLMQSMICSEKTCPGLVLIMQLDSNDGYSCNTCGLRVTEEKIKEYHAVTQLSDHHLQNMNSSERAFIDVCEMVLSKQEKILSNLNIRRIKIVDLAFEACINFQRWSAALKYGYDLLSVYRKYYGFYHPLVGLLHMKVLKLILLENDQENSIELYEDAVKILSITHGKSHPLFETLEEIMYR